MGKSSAGILLYRWRDDDLEVFLVHPGGPYWRAKDAASWSIPKGEYTVGEDPIAAAKREFWEETGFEVGPGILQSLGEVRLSSGKLVRAWAIEGDCDADTVRSNSFSMEWPPRSGRTQEFPEVDRAGWFTVELAREKIHTSQCAFLDRLAKIVEDGGLGSA
jgi:predicted NUDIX family NTP pyrophosphohydrolase